jgi:predicted nucleotidyltransferase
MRLDDELIQEIVGRVSAVAQPDRIVLFGSAATGTMTADSDIDLLVLESAPGNTRRESVRIRRALRGLGFPIDVFVMRTDRFEQTKDVIGGIAYPAATAGRTIYAVS